MKKSTKFFAALAVVTLIMSSCITATVLRAQWAVDEKEEITSGKVFEEKQGTFFYSYKGYSEGLILCFKDSGEYIYVENKAAKTFVVITPKKVFYGDMEDKTYIVKDNNKGTYYYSNLSMVFPIQWFRWEKFADDMVDSEESNKKEGTVYFTPKEGGDFKNLKCNTFTDDGYEVLGYNRIYISKKENGKQVFELRRTRKNCAYKFEVPTGYKEVSGSIDFNENF